MGSMFGGSKPRSSPSISPQQEALLGPLYDYYLRSLNQSSSPGVGEIDSVLSGDSPFVSKMASNIFRDALLKPSLQQFERVTKPGIASGFARIGATLSSRRGQAIAAGYQDVHNNAQAQLAAAIPNFIQLQLSGIASREQLRNLPAQLAGNFATQPTRSLGSVGGNNAGGQILGAIGTGVGLYFGGPAGGAAGGQAGSALGGGYSRSAGGYGG